MAVSLPQEQRLTNFSVEVETHTVNILGYMDRKASVATTQFCCYN